jgi:GntR family transcriptional repressor for pyruvate dehydrogenase complex
MAAKMVDSDAQETGKSDQPRPKAKASLVDEAYRKILAMITEEALVGGERLPSESEMAVQLGVSRPVVRHALSRLQHSGVVEVRWGAGTYVQNAANVPPSDFSFGPVRSLDEVRHAYVFRATIEGDAAALAAGNRSEASRAGVYRALEKLEKALGSSAEAQEADLEFHLAVSAASENRFFLSALQSIQRSVEFSINLARTLSLTHPQERLLVVQAEHVAVLRAIEAGDVEGAREAMRTHLGNACKRLFQGPGG